MRDCGMQLTDENWEGIEMVMYAILDGLVEETVERRVVFNLVQMCSISGGPLELQQRIEIGSFEVHLRDLVVFVGSLELLMKVSLLTSRVR